MSDGKEHNCKRCGFKWASRIDEMPLACPRCKSYRWGVKKRETYRWSVKR